MTRSIALIGLLGLLSGCASTLGTIFNRPVVEDGIQEVVSTMSLAADRRMVVVVTDGVNKTKFCAEPPPDTATGLKTELEASLKAEAKSEEAKADASGEGQVKDAFLSTITVLAARTAALDAYRSGVYALCQYHLNGAVKPEEVGTLFVKLIDAFERSGGKAMPASPSETKPQKQVSADSGRSQSQTNADGYSVTHE